MFSSQITSISQNSASPSLLLASIPSSTAILRSTRTIQRRSRPHNQIRSIRIGLWSSYLEPGFEKEFRRRNRALKHKYIEAINRKLSWDRQHAGLTRQFGLKGFMCSAWRGHYTRPGGRWVDMDKLDPNKPETVKTNNSGIEDVELSAFDQLWGKDGFYELLQKRSRAFRYEAILSNIARGQEPFILRATNEPEGSKPIVQNSPNTDADKEYNIDPITNRKVFKFKPIEVERKPIEVPVKTFNGNRSQFQDFQPPESKSTEHKSNSNKSTPADQNSRTMKPDPTRECLEDYEGTETYKPYFAYEPNGEKPDPIQDGLKDFDTRSSYRSWSSWFVSKEKTKPDTPSKVCPVQEGLKDYDERTSYEASSPKSVSDLPSHPDPVQHGLKDFDAIAPYGPVKTSDTSTATSPSPLSSDVEGGLQDYDSKTSYGPVLHNEPDGKAPTTQEATTADDGLSEFDNKVDYGSRRILKNISLNRGNSKTDKSFRYQSDIDTGEDLDLLRASDVRASSGIIRGPKKESEVEKLAKRKELEDDFMKPQDLESAFVEHRFNDSLTKDTDERVGQIKGRPQESKSTPIKLPISDDTLEKIDELKGKHRMGRKLTGNFVRDFPEEFQTSWKASENAFGSLSPSSKTYAWGYDKAPKGLELSYQQEVANDIQKAEQEYIEGRASKESFARNPETPRLQTSLDRRIPQEPEMMESHKLQAEIDPYSKTPQGLETSYAEECKLQNEIDPYSKEPQGLETSYANECTAKYDEGDAQSTITKESIKTSHPDKELVEELQSIAASVQPLSTDYTVEAGRAQPVKSNVEAPEAPEPTVYKILAYDPTMQSISTAETTSIVSDSASALTPAEVLLRLSNPTKFFPHFQPLQAEGYEIVSGSGDVLVFRKVRAAGPVGSKSESSSPYEDRARNTTNPIDGMRPIAATGNFASPTGFVNYDRPESSEPPFKSNIDVRREEPVFSGKSSWSEDTEQTKRKKPSLAKRVLVGGAMVGGCSYAIGVVAEYFKSGGIDGLGPQTF